MRLLPASSALSIIALLFGCIWPVGPITIETVVRSGDRVIARMSSEHDVEPRFNIELVHMGGEITDSEWAEIRRAADRWEEVILTDFEPLQMYTPVYASRKASWWFDFHRYEAKVDGTIDDLKIYVGSGTGPVADSLAATGGPFHSIQHKGHWMTKAGAISFNFDAIHRSDASVYYTALHEIGHVLGFGFRWHHLLINPGTDRSFFPGEYSIAAFDGVGGKPFQGGKVPLEWDDNHWRESVFGSEIMSRWANPTEHLSIVTLSAMMDMGWDVNLAKADPYSLPKPVTAKPVSATLRCLAHPYDPSSGQAGENQ